MKSKILIAISFLLFFICAPDAIVNEGIPFLWHINGRFVESKDHYGGKFYQVNDTLKIIAIEGGGTYDKYALYVLENGDWKKTNQETYMSTSPSYRQAISSLRFRYARSSRQKPWK